MRPQRSSKYGFLMISPPKKLNVDGLHQFQASGGTHAEEPDRAPPALPRRDKLCRSQQVEGLPSQKSIAGRLKSWERNPIAEVMEVPL